MPDSSLKIEKLIKTWCFEKDKIICFREYCSQSNYHNIYIITGLRQEANGDLILLFDREGHCKEQRLYLNSDLKEDIDIWERIEVYERKDGYFLNSTGYDVSTRDTYNNFLGIRNGYKYENQ